MYPWQQRNWQQLQQMQRLKRLPHAVLLAGIRGLGKAEFAHALAKALLCQGSSEQACGECHACHLVAGNVHPNLLQIAPEKAGAAIKVDQIRQVADFIYQSSLAGYYRIVIITAADSMNTNAANALLKTLEEPPTGALMLLVSDVSERMPATILSRCSIIQFTKPTLTEGTAWLSAQLNKPKVPVPLLLQLSQGAPLAALALHESGMLDERRQVYDALAKLATLAGDPVALAASIQQTEALQILDLLASWLLDMTKIKLVSEGTTITNEDYLAALQACVQQMSLTAQEKLLAMVQQLRAQTLAGINLNKQLWLETFFIKWKQLCC